MTVEIIQRSDDWYAARCGSLGASQVHMAIARTKTGWGASRDNVMAQLIAERMTGQPQESFTNAAMRWGTETEPQARAMYEIERGVDVVEVGLYRHPTIAGTHASPDGLVGDDGLVEIKCPNTATHIDTLLSQSIDGKYITQMQWQMACAGRAWCDFVSFDSRMPADLQMWVRRVERDDKVISDLEELVAGFIRELENKLARLESLRMAME
jgi:putative phage-type endonuclease